SLYLSLLYIPDPHTIYREVRKLEPGHLLVWQNGGLINRRYWDLAQIQPSDGAVRPAAVRAELLSLLTDAVRRQLVSDVPLGTFLSGGLDSSTVVALTRQVHSGSLKTFSIGFDDPSYDERADARRIARAFETDHTELTVTPDVADLVPKLVHHFDEPFADSSAIPTYYLSQLTRRHVTVALGGDGGDELFAGYVTYQADKLARLYERLPAALTRRILPALAGRLPVSEGKVSLDFKARRFVANALQEPARRHSAWEAFFDAGLGLKHLLKQTMRGILPEETLRKRKAGFSVPLAAWLKRELRPLVEEYLSPSRIRRDGFFRPETTSRLVTDHMAGRADYSRNIWALLLFGLWLERDARTPAIPIAAIHRNGRAPVLEGRSIPTHWPRPSWS